MNATVWRNDLEIYAAATDPGGPAMVRRMCVLHLIIIYFNSHFRQRFF
jgi:hypothetical protein